MRVRACIIGIVMTGGCYQAPPMSVEGNIDVRGELLGGEWSLDPGICAGGFYKGIDVSSADGSRCVRFVEHPEDGPQIHAFVPGTDEGFVFTEDDCDTFYVRLDRTVDQDGNLYNHGGEIELECASEVGTVVGHVEFDGCW